MKLYIVDAFTEVLFGGNPAGVVILSDNEQFPDNETMRKTAAELRYSETAFVKKIGEDNFQTRYFTPAAEVDLCGHATIGTFSVLKLEGLVKENKTYYNDTLAGKLKIEVGENKILMEMGEAKEIGTISDEKELERLYSIMGLDYNKTGTEMYPKMISTGLPDIMMPVKDEDALAEISPDFSALSKLSDKYGVVGVHAFTVNTKDEYVHCRNFAPLYEIDEEAATGTSNGALTYYLYLHNLKKDGSETSFIQGEAMKRPSKIDSKISLKEGKPEIMVGGSAVVLVRGEINI
jgi:PhzF family phenazine biosynthesis protein